MGLSFVDAQEVMSEASESKEDIPLAESDPPVPESDLPLSESQDLGMESLSFYKNADLDSLGLDIAGPMLPRLPSRKSELRLVKDYFQQIHDSAGRIRETFFNLQGALRLTMSQDTFISK